MKNIKLSIIIPVYNELNTVLEVVRRVQNESHEKEILIVDDGSNDGTIELLRQIKSENIKILFHDTNKGKGAAIRTAIKYITGDITIIQDADLEYYPDEYGILINKIVEGKADVVYGTRFLGSHRVFHFYHYLGNLLINLIANFILDANLTDLMTGYKAFKTSTLKKLILQANRFGIEAEITAEIFKRKLRLFEVPISYEGRGYEEGKKIRWMDFFSCVYWLIKSMFRGIDIGTETLLRIKLMRNNNNWVYHKMEPFLGKKILELGSGIGTISKYLVSYGREVILTDINKEYLSYLNNRFIGNPFVRIIEIDINNIDEKFKNEKVDTILGVNVLEHIEKDLELLRNLRQILIKDGRLLLLIPAHNVLFGVFDKNLQHYRRYSKKELIDKLTNAGFSLEKIEYMNFLAAIGWFIEYKIFKRKHMAKIKIQFVDKLIPIIALVEKYIKFPFGLSLIVIAKVKIE